MLLGKRPRGALSRTTSMAGINVDLGDVEALESSDDPHPVMMNGQGRLGAQEGRSGLGYHVNSSTGGDRHIVIETAHFLRRCGLCKRRLVPDHDIYMYKGDTAFCSVDCREKQMKHDEIKEKCHKAAKKDDNHHHHHHQYPAPPAAATSQA